MALRVNNSPTISPIYEALPKFNLSIGAAYTGKVASLTNKHFSFHRPSSLESSLDSQEEAEKQKIFQFNLAYLAAAVGFSAPKVTLPNGTWPHSGQAIVAEAPKYEWIKHTRTGTLVPVTSKDYQPVTCDGIATRSDRFVLAVQGADCPAIFLYDPVRKVIGLSVSP